MARLLSRPVSRRSLIGGAATAAAGAALLPLRRSAAAPLGHAIEVLYHDEVHEGAAFGRGRAIGALVRNGTLQGAGTFESPTIAAPFGFTHVGLHWRGSGPRIAELVFELRTSADGQTWTQWQHLHIEASPSENPFGETFASLVGAPKHSFVQYRTNLPGGHAIGRVTATLLNSEDGPTVQTTSVGVLSSGTPIDFSREAWGCDERLRFRGKNEIWPRMFVPVKKLAVHHTASSPTADGAAEVRAIYTYHARSLGWGDIGYNALIDRSGNSYEGRYGRDWSGGREIFSPDVVAGHVASHNYGTCGVAIIGNYENESISMASAAVQRLLDVLEHMAREREIDPHAGSPFLQSNDAWNPSVMNVFAHRDANATLCPGANLYPLMSNIRSALNGRLALAAAPAFLSGPDGVTQNTGSLSYSWSGPGGAEFKYYLEGWYKAVSSENITYLTGFTADRRPAWPTSWTTATSAAFSGLSDGRYTLHALRRDGTGTTYQSNRTVLISGASSGGGGGGGGPPPGRGQNR